MAFNDEFSEIDALAAILGDNVIPKSRALKFLSKVIVLQQEALSDLGKKGEALSSQQDEIIRILETGHLDDDQRKNLNKELEKTIDSLQNITLKLNQLSESMEQTLEIMNNVRSEFEEMKQSAMNSDDGNDLSKYLNWYSETSDSDASSATDEQEDDEVEEETTMELGKEHKSVQTDTATTSEGEEEELITDGNNNGVHGECSEITNSLNINNTVTSLNINNTVTSNNEESTTTGDDEEDDKFDDLNKAIWKEIDQIDDSLKSYSDISKEDTTESNTCSGVGDVCDDDYQ